MLQIVLTVFALVVSLITGRVILGEFNTTVWVSVGVAGLVVSNLIWANRKSVGHGVGGRRHILEMPILLFAGYLINLAFALSTAFVESSTIPVTDASFRVLGISVLCGWVAALIEWHARSYWTTYYFVESEIRRMLNARGYPEYKVKETLDKMSAEGFFDPEVKI